MISAKDANKNSRGVWPAMMIIVLLATTKDTLMMEYASLAPMLFQVVRSVPWLIWLLTALNVWMATTNLLMRVAFHARPSIRTADFARVGIVVLNVSINTISNRIKVVDYAVTNICTATNALPKDAWSVQRAIMCSKTAHAHPAIILIQIVYNANLKLIVLNV